MNQILKKSSDHSEAAPPAPRSSLRTPQARLCAASPCPPFFADGRPAAPSARAGARRPRGPFPLAAPDRFESYMQNYDRFIQHTHTHTHTAAEFLVLIGQRVLIHTMQIPALY